MNVLVYSGKGSTAEGVRHTVELLRQLLSPYYAVVTVSDAALLNDPWQSKTRMLVFPGGADLPYCDTFNGKGNKKIAAYVKGGGLFLGLCAGAYYALARCEFEVGNPLMEVSGSRELGFYPGVLRGCVYRGFEYDTHAGARAAKLSVNTAALGRSGLDLVMAYYNGGGAFLDAEKHRNVEVLATYTDPCDIADDQGSSGGLAAVVLCKVGRGLALLTGAHPEYTPSLMRPAADDIHFQSIVAQLAAHELLRRLFLAACLARLGLKVNETGSLAPQLTPLYVAAPYNKPGLMDLYLTLRSNLEFTEGNTYEDINDTFVMHTDADSESTSLAGQDDAEGAACESLEQIIAAPKNLRFCLSSVPDARATPYFSMPKYFNTLNALYSSSDETTEHKFGTILGYGEVVSSTNTLMDANPNWLRHLPTGFTLTATTQVAGRGRGGNVWVNPHGVMATSVLFRVPSTPEKNFAIVTLQYLCSLVVIELILNYGAPPGAGVGYEDMPLRLKWPNDMYALKPDYFKSFADKDNTSDTVDGDEQKWVKVSGALVNSQFIDGQFYLVWGSGVNVLNEAPTTSLNSVLAQLNKLRAARGQEPLPDYSHEELLARVVYTMGQFYSVFQRTGLKPFLSLYYKRWFHLGQRVKLEDGASTRDCVIKGITSEYGLLVAEDVHTHESLELQPDGNSFDIFKGLVYKKR